MSEWRDIKNTADFPDQMGVEEFLAALNGEAVQTDDESGRTKFNTRQVSGIEEDGLKFDSKLERRWYAHLRKLEMAGAISDLKLHPEFLIADPVFPQLTQGRFVKPMKYTADFQWTEGDRQIVVDVKGYAGKKAKDGVVGSGGLVTDAVLLRVRLFLVLHGENYVFRMIIGEPLKPQVWEFDVLEGRQTYYGAAGEVLREYRSS